MQIAPSLLSADFARLADQVALVSPWASRFHIDVMDGHFVPNLSMGPAVVEALRPHTDLPLEVHLMVSDPAAFVDPFVKAGSDRLIFHIEVVQDVAALARAIRAAGASAGVALKPGTSWPSETHWLELLDLVLVMTVEPGFSGQAFMTEMLPKVTAARAAVKDGADVEVDGGIDKTTGVGAREAGANVFVAGHAIFRAEDPARAAKELSSALA